MQYSGVSIEKVISPSTESKINVNDGSFVMCVPAKTFKEDVRVCVREIIAGPFELPAGYQAASLAYCVELDKEDMQFQNDISIRIRHCAEIKSKEDCTKLEFMSASLSKSGKPVYYTFNKIKGGNFSSDLQHGEISLNHFSYWMIGATSLGAGIIIGGTAMYLWSKL